MSNLDLAIRTGTWLLSNQVKEVPHVNPCSMDVGRFPINMHIHEHKIVDGFLSTNWYTGMSVFALLMLRDWTGEERWKAAAELAGHHLRCLQITMDPDPAAQGALYEYAPYNRFCLPRDAVSGAWGMLRLYRATGNVEYLNRVELFAKWHMEQAMVDGYPIREHRLGAGPNNNEWGGYQGGVPAFYFDLHDATGKDLYRETALGICDIFMEHFWNSETGIPSAYNRATGYRGDAKGDSRDWNEMHKFNDDFAGVALMTNAVLTGNRRCLDWVDTYMQWCLKQQNDDGSFGRPRLSVSSCVAALNLLNAGQLLGRKEYSDAAGRAREHLMRSYQQDPGCPAVDGGVLGLHHCAAPKEPNMICLRVTNYTVYTLMLFGLIDKERAGEAIPESVRQNPMFPGLSRRATASVQSAQNGVR